MFLEPFVTKTVQSPSSSAPPKRATTRLAKSRQSSHVFSKNDTSSFFGDSSPDPSRMQHSSGQNPPDTRHIIRREISGGFGDMSHNGPDQPQSNQDTSVHDGISWNAPTPQLGQTCNANQSSLTLNGQSHGQVSAMPEYQLDVGQAISLLQELKKTATPDELVALHRALLPTREVLLTQSPPLAGHSDVPPPPRMARRRTAIPPGLATRAGFDEDLLRRPEEVSVSGRPANKQRRVPEHQGIQIPKKTLMALDLADDTSSMAGVHTISPAESAYIHTGMYRHGTLWVTNRSATPELSVVSGVSSRTKTVGTHLLQGSSDATAAPRKVGVEAVQQEVLPTSIDEHRQVMEVHEPAKPKTYHTVQNTDRTSQRQDLSVARHIPSEKQDAKVTAIRHKQHYQVVAENDITPAKWADGPDSVPQLDHSPTHLSSGHNVDYDTISNPSEDRALANSHTTEKSFSSEESTAVPRQDCLKNADYVDTQRTEVYMPAESREDARKYSGPMYETKVVPRAFDSHQNGRPKTMHHPDSGYGSDVTSYDIKNRGSREVKPLETIHVVTYPDCQSRDRTAAPTESPTSAKKFSPFARIKSMTAARRKSMPSSNPESQLTPNTDAAITQQISPAGLMTVDHTNRETKKLQKPMPKAVLRQREAKIQSLRSDAAEQSLEPISKRDASLEQGLHSDVANKPAELSVTNAPLVEAKLPVCLDGESPDDRGRRSVKPDFDHQRVRSKTVHGSREAFVPEFAKPSGVSRMRSKSLGRNVHRGFEQSGNDQDFTQPRGDDRSSNEPPQQSTFASSNVPINSKARMPEVLSKGRSIPTLQFFQHERRYQIEPGFVMPNPAKISSEATVSRPSHVRGHKYAKSSVLPIERSQQQVFQAQGSGDGGSEDTMPMRSAELIRSNETKASMRDFPHSPVENGWRPYSLQIGNSIGGVGLPAQNSDRVTKENSAHSADRNLGAQASRPMADHSIRNDHAYPQHGLVEANATDQQTQTTESMSVDDQRWRYPELNENSYHSVTASYPGNEQQQNEQPAMRNNMNPMHDAQHSGWPGWERQAQLWRERRENAGANLTYQMEYAGEGQRIAPVPPPHSPHPPSEALAVSHQARVPYDEFRYLGSPSPRPTGTAAEQANAYQTLILDSHESRPAKTDVPRTDSAQSTATFYSVQTSYDRTPTARPSGPRPQSALSYSRPADPVARTPRDNSHESEEGHIRTNSGQYIPYRPRNAPQPEPSRHQPMPHEQRPTLPGSDTQYQTGKLESLCDRFGGGLGFGWDRAAGMKGSAGFRANPTHRPPPVSEDGRGPSPVGRKYGIDLSDVPLFVQKL